MVFTNDDYLPTFDELKIPEIQMSSAPLRAGAQHFGKYCDKQSKEFMLCSKEENDPRKCLNEGKEVTRCATDFFQKLRNTCAEEFASYWTCLDNARQDMNMKYCSTSRGIFDKCVFDKMGVEKTELGHFSRVRVHETSRPKPSVDIPLPEALPEPIDPSKAAVPESSKLGSRFVFMN